MTKRLGQIAIVAVATALVLLVSATVAAQCCTHLGQSVQCPPGLPPGSGSLDFVQGGTMWGTPSGGKVFVPSATFAACSGTPTAPGAPSQPSTTPPTSPTAPPATTPKPSPSNPPTATTPATTTTPPTPGAPQHPS